MRFPLAAVETTNDCKAIILQLKIKKQKIKHMHLNINKYRMNAPKLFTMVDNSFKFVHSLCYLKHLNKHVLRP